MDAPAHRVTLSPHLPPQWTTVSAAHIPVGGGEIAVSYTRTRDVVSASVTRTGNTGPIDLVFSPALPLGARVTTAGATIDATAGDVHATVSAPLVSTVALSVSYTGGWAIETPAGAPAIGQRSSALRVISERLDGGRYTAALEGVAGRTYQVRVHGPTGVQLMAVTFPTSGANPDGYTAASITLGGR